MKHELNYRIFKTMTKGLIVKFAKALFVVTTLYYIYVLVSDTNIKWTLPKLVTLWGLAIIGIFVVAALFDDMFKNKS